MKKTTLILALIIASISSSMASTVVVDKVFPGTVLIATEDKNGQYQSLGTGFLVSPNVIATNFHVIENSHSGYVKFVNKDKVYEIDGVVGYSSEYDLALIKIEDNSGTPLTLKSPAVDIGQKIFAIGNPLGLEGTISDGIVSGLRDLEGFSLLQISAPISPGSSGGPVVNENGEVVGVATLTYIEGQNLNFAVPIKYLKELLDNQTEQVSLSSLVEIKSTTSNIQSSKDFGGVSFTKLHPENFGYSLSFSIKNNLRKDIENIYSVWIIYDSDGEPIHSRNFRYKYTIQSKMAIRTSLRPGDSAISYLKSTNKIIDGKDVLKYIEYRILDFDILE